MLALYYSPIEESPAPIFPMAEDMEVEGQPIKDATPSTAAEAALPSVPEGGLQTATSENQSKALEATSSIATEAAPPGVSDGGLRTATSDDQPKASEVTPSTATEGAPPYVSVGGPQTATRDNQSKDSETTPSVIDRKAKIVLYWYDIPNTTRMICTRLETHNCAIPESLPKKNFMRHSIDMTL